jgi:hypothetical protein
VLCNVYLQHACNCLPIELITTTIPVLSDVAISDTYHEIDIMNEGIGQMKIIKDSNYESVKVVFEDGDREERMKLLHTPE